MILSRYIHQQIFRATKFQRKARENISFRVRDVSHRDIGWLPECVNMQKKYDTYLPSVNALILIFLIMSRRGFCPRSNYAIFDLTVNSIAITRLDCFFKRVFRLRSFRTLILSRYNGNVMICIIACIISSCLY